MDMLVEIPRSKWLDLRDLYKAAWPRGAVGYCVLDFLKANTKLSQSVNFKVYSPDGDISNGMIAIVDSLGGYHLLIHPINGVAKIEEALEKTNVIDWDRNIILPSASIDVIDCVKRLQERLKIKIKLDDVKAFKHVLDEKKPMYDLSSCPPDTYVGPIKREHIPLVDKTWVYHDETTHLFFELLVQNGMTYAVYSIKDDALMAWITVGAEAALTHLFTLEPYRRLGYAEFITKYAVNDLRKKGRTVLAYTVEGNTGSQRMFEKLGFDVIGYDRWVFIEREK